MLRLQFLARLRKQDGSRSDAGVFLELAFPVMVLANAFLYEQAPDGSKPVAHREMKSRDMAARMLSAVGELPESDEVALTAEVTDVLTMQDGGPPKGWLAPP